MKNNRYKPHQHGFTLVEILIAMLIGLFLLSGLLTIYSSNKNSFNLQQALSSVQRNGQFSLDVISQNINTAGYAGFIGDMSKNVENVLNNPENQLWDITSPILGFDQIEQGLEIAGISGFQENTDVLLLKQITNSKYLVDNSDSKSIVVKDSKDLLAGDILLLSDIDQASLFQAKEISAAPNGSKIVLDTSNTFSPGNNQELDNSYTTYSELSKLSVHMYYIKTGRNNQLALFEASLVNDGAQLKLEEHQLASNVQDLQLTYGEDTNNDGEVDTFESAASVANWDNVISIGVALLVSNDKDLNTIASSPLKFDANDFIFKQDQDATSKQRKLLKSFRTFAAIRNRTL